MVHRPRDHSAEVVFPEVVPIVGHPAEVPFLGAVPTDGQEAPLACLAVAPTDFDSPVESRPADCHSSSKTDLLAGFQLHNLDNAP